MRLGIYDVRYQPEKRAYKCSKDLNGEIPRDVLKNCKFTYGRHTVGCFMRMDKKFVTPDSHEITQSDRSRRA